MPAYYSLFHIHFCDENLIFLKTHTKFLVLIMTFLIISNCSISSQVAYHALMIKLFLSTLGPTIHNADF